MSIDHRIDDSKQLATKLNKSSGSYYANAYGIKGDGITNDTIALQNLINLIFTKHSLVEPFHRDTTSIKNIRMGVIEFEPGSRVLIDGVHVPPGITLQGNDCTFVANSATTMFYFDADLNPDTVYAGQGGGMQNCVLQGQHLATRGIHNNRCCWQFYENVTVTHIDGIAWTLWEVQYTTYINCQGYVSKVGWYLTSNPANNDLCTIDVTFLRCVSKINMYGFWAQNCGKVDVIACDISFNTHLNVLVGRQLKNFISGYTLVSGGSGYTPSAMIPMTITDSTGTLASGYVRTNSSGVVNQVCLGECGSEYTAPTVSVAGGTEAAVITAIVDDHSTLGDWDGTSYTSRAGISFTDLKCENDDDVQIISGYGVAWINGTGNKFVRFKSVSMAAQQTTVFGSSYLKWVRSDSQYAYIENPLVKQSSMYAENPSLVGDYSMYRSTIGNGIKLFLTGSSTEPSTDIIAKLVVDENNVPALSNRASIFSLNLTEGLVCAKETLINTSTTASLLSLKVPGEANNRLEVTMSGIKFGNGSSAPDATIKRTSAGLLNTPDQFQASDGIRLKTLTTAPVDGDFIIVGSGLMVLDTTTSRLWIRVGSTWKSVLLL